MLLKADLLSFDFLPALIQFATWSAKTPSVGSLDSAAQLALESFNLAATGFADNVQAREMIREMSISPIAEAATALRNILTRSPGRFATPEALTALGSKSVVDI